MKAFGLLGWSGSGKTTLVVELLPELRRRGLTVSTIKHTHHNVDVDRPGKDSFRHREAGATEVVLASSARWALLHELGDEPEPDVDDLIARMTPVDLLLIEGFKTYPHPKLEVFRPSVGKEMIGGADDSVVAIASDEPIDGAPVPILELNDIPAIANFIIGYCRLSAANENGAA